MNFHVHARRERVYVYAPTARTIRQIDDLIAPSFHSRNKFILCSFRVDAPSKCARLKARLCHDECMLFHTTDYPALNYSTVALTVFAS